MSEGIVTIKPGREKPILQQHPWIFSGAIASARHAEPGSLVTVVSSKGDFLARGFWNPKSQIQVRILTWQDEPIDDDWWRRMLKRAIDARYTRPQYGVGNRIINAENDFLPGLIVDRYADFLVLQALTLYIDQNKTQIAPLLADAFHAAGMPLTGIYERSDVDVRGKEGLKQHTGVLWGEAPPNLIRFGPEKLIHLVDIRNGHKTGCYLDQMDNHAVLSSLTSSQEFYAPESRILNLFSYTGGFGLTALGHVINVDSSAEALALAAETYRLNEWPEDEAEFIQADVFEYLREAVAHGEQFDVIVCDPPKFAHNKQQVERATRGYKDLNLHCFKLIKPGGYLMTFSCSGAIDADLFQKVVFGALADSGRQAQIIRHLGPSEDHPVALTFPEGAYLKGLLLRVY
jgi:23S rRNA (cytosine1962-C5)-methyltransferase